MGDETTYILRPGTHLIDSVDGIPSPSTIRRDLAIVYRQADLLRRLLKIAVTKERQLSPAALDELDRDAKRMGRDGQ